MILAQSNPFLITVHVRSYRFQITTQPIGIQSDCLERLAHGPFSARELVLLEELLNLMRFLLGGKVLSQVFDQTGQEESALKGNAQIN